MAIFRYSRLIWQVDPPMSQGTWTPAVDVYETRDKVILSAELPGVDRDQISIEVEGSLLVLRGERRLKRDLREESCHRMERDYGPFLRVFKLPNPVNPAQIQTSFKEGLLDITLPKVGEGEARKIDIEVVE